MSFSRPIGLPYQPHLDGLRGLAVLLVVIFHAFPETLPGGFIGVDVFFVLSGFLITQLVLAERNEGTFSYRRFLGRRVRRLAPAFLLVSAASMAFAWQGLFAEGLLENAKALAASLLLSANWYFYTTTDYFAADTAGNLFLHIWSLSIEEQFYLVFPLALIVVPRRHLALTLMVATALFYVAAIMSLALMRPEQAFFATYARVWELLFGCLLAAGLPTITRLAARRPRSVSILLRAVTPGLLGVVACAALFSDSTPIPGPPLLLPMVAVVPALLWRVLSPEGAGRWGAGILETAPAVFLGKISYSLYLWHWPLLVMTRTLIADPEDWHLALAVLVAGVLSWLTFRFVENPIRRRRRLGTALPLAASVVAGWAYLAVTAGQAINRDGAPERIPEAAFAALAGKDDFGGERRRCSPLPPAHPLTGDPVWMTRELCLLGSAAPDAPVIVLWGDSHAGALAPAFDVIARENGVTLAVFSVGGGCPPLAGVAWSRLGPEERKQCEAFNEAAMRYIETTAPAAVVMAGHWALYAPRLDGRAGRIAVAGGPWRPDGLPDAADEAFYIALRKTAARITQYTDLRLFLDVPTHAFSVPEAMAQARIWPFLPSPGYETRSGHARARRTFAPMMEALAAEGLLTVHDPMDVLCPVEECLVALDGRPLYFDANHLSNTGAALVLTNMAEVTAPPPPRAAETPAPRGDAEDADGVAKADDDIASVADEPPTE